MTELILKAEKRENIGGSNPKNIVKDGFVPGVVYGPGFEVVNLKVKYQELVNIFSLAQKGKAIDLDLDGKSLKVFINDIQRDILSDKIIHVDFYKFDENKKFSVEVPLIFEGESRAVKESVGVLVTSLNSIFVEGLYANLITEIKVDLSKLENLNDVIYVRELDISDKLNVLTAKDQVIISVKVLRAKIQEESTEDTKTEDAGDEEKKDASEEGDDKEKASAEKSE